VAGVATAAFVKNVEATEFRGVQVELKDVGCALVEDSVERFEVGVDLFA
jgi:hypothetical protein